MANKASHLLKYPWFQKDVKPYVLEPLDDIKLSRSQYIATSIMSYGSYINKMFVLKNFTYAFCRQLSQL